MPRNCGCAGSACSCLIQGGNGVTVDGSGNSSDPYVISVQNNQGVANLGQQAAASTLDNRGVTTDTKFILEALGTLNIRPPETLGVRADYFIQNSTNALITILGTVFWDGAAPTLNGTRIWLTLVCYQGGTFWAARGGTIA